MLGWVSLGNPGNALDKSTTYYPRVLRQTPVSFLFTVERVPSDMAPTMSNSS